MTRAFPLFAWLRDFGEHAADQGVTVRKVIPEPILQNKQVQPRTRRASALHLQVITPSNILISKRKYSPPRSGPTGRGRCLSS